MLAILLDLSGCYPGWSNPYSDAVRMHSIICTKLMRLKVRSIELTFPDALHSEIVFISARAMNYKFYFSLTIKRQIIHRRRILYKKLMFWYRLSEKKITL